ncbi:hypothetical protein GQA09_00425 [Escherichia coli]|uniref:Uncharacterized protein n=1 Tax=Escherichia coli TaxID=562 RepID=A0AAW9WYQ8_ECOLX|nr:hypothetical protein [Escherichia coli]MWQ92619.1 hypothetical protein [Escherichia coli]MWU29375.1 hypothetical protein [Escherichia coli]
MLENYYKNGPIATDDKAKRLIAVQAALEIAKASVSANTADSNDAKARWDLAHVAGGIEALADAIQASLKVK